MSNGSGARVEAEFVKRPRRLPLDAERLSIRPAAACASHCNVSRRLETFARDGLAAFAPLPVTPSLKEDHGMAVAPLRFPPPERIGAWRSNSGGAAVVSAA